MITRQQPVFDITTDISRYMSLKHELQDIKHEIHDLGGSLTDSSVSDISDSSWEKDLDVLGEYNQLMTVTSSSMDHMQHVSDGKEGATEISVTMQDGDRDVRKLSGEQSGGVASLSRGHGNIVHIPRISPAVLVEPTDESIPSGRDRSVDVISPGLSFKQHVVERHQSTMIHLEHLTSVYDNLSNADQRQRNVGENLLFSGTGALDYLNVGRKYYGVRRGRSTGVFDNWPDTKDSVHGYSHSEFRKFSCVREAQAYVDDDKSNSENDACDQHVDKIFTDGSCFDSGTPDARAGIGFYWGPDESRTVAPGNKVYYPSVQQNRSTGVLEDSTGAPKYNRSTGVFDNWPDTKDSVHGYPPSEFRKFSSVREAQAYVDDEKYDNENDNCDQHVAKIFTDGNCFDCGTPDARAGIGIYWGPDDSRNISQRLVGRQTSQRAEIVAAKVAILQAKQLSFDYVIIKTDSEQVERAIEEWIPSWQVKGWYYQNGKPVKNREDYEALLKVIEDVKVEWDHVPAHTHFHGNEAADRLAKLGADKPCRRRGLQYWRS